MSSGSSDSSLSGAVAVVTGGASGIGAALAARLDDAGATVTIADVDADAAAAVAADVGCYSSHLDVGSSDAWASTLAQIVGRHGGLDIVCLNAGVGTRPRGTSVADDPIPWIADGYRSAMSVNVDGVVYGTMAALPHLETSGGGRIVVTASVAGIRPQPPDPIYALTKSAVIGFVRSIAPALGQRGVSINALCPGSVDTPLMPDDRRHLAASMSTPDEMAEAICMVLTEAGTGETWIASSPGLPVWRYEFAPVMDGPPA